MEFTTYLRFVLVLVLVVGLILGLAWAVKRFGLTGALQGSLGRKRRVTIVETAALDGRHRMVLVRRDDVEHLLLIGPNTSQVIERGIPVSTSDPAAFSQFLSQDKES